MLVDKDSFSSGQIGSKLWLCETLETLFNDIDNIWIYGGWYGLTNFLLRTRNRLNIKTVRSFDIDPACEEIADRLNENWVWQDWQFKSFTADCGRLFPKLEEVDMIINTSTEHFSSLQWFENIPKGMTVVLQGADMKHEDHVFKFSSLDSFVKTFNLSEIYFSGQRNFKYPDWEFNRFMLIGIK